MIQELRKIEREPSTKERFANAFAGVAQKGVPMIAEHFAGKERMAQENEAIKRLTGQDVSGLSPELKQTFMQKFQSTGAAKPSAAQEKAQAQAASFEQGLGTIKEMRALLPKVGMGSGITQVFSKDVRNARQQFSTLGTSLIGLYGSTLPTGIRNKTEFEEYMKGIAKPGQREATMEGSLDALEKLFQAGMIRNQIAANPGLALTPQGEQMMNQVKEQELEAVTKLKESQKQGQFGANAKKIDLKEIWK
jgi:hypothetical protein